MPVRTSASLSIFNTIYKRWSKTGKAGVFDTGFPAAHLENFCLEKANFTFPCTLSLSKHERFSPFDKLTSNGWYS